MISNHPPVWPDYLENELWAKSAAKGVDGAPESLARHTWLVLERLADFINLRSDLPARFGTPELWNILYWATFLHDFGKVMPAFQRLLRADATARKEWGSHRHELFSLAFVDWVAPGFTAEQLAWVVAAIVSHHRDKDAILRLYPTPEPGELDPLVEPLSGIPEHHVTGLYQWLATCGWAWAQHFELDQLGVLPIPFSDELPPFTASDAAKLMRSRLRQYRRLAPPRQAAGHDDRTALIFLRGMILSADHSGSAHAENLPRVTLSSQQVLGKRKLTLYDHQKSAAKTTGSTLLIAPTGAGKTEAALLWAARQAAESNTPRLFYTLPYQASMNAMVRRLAETFGRGHVGLQHGRALLATYRWLMEEGEQPENAGKVARERQNLAGLHYPPVRVFSPYQMLKAMYRLKGYEAQLADYHDGLFIFDEIHAYDVQRLALILCTITYLRRYYNARFFIMSATFPTLIRQWLQEALGETPCLTTTPELFAKFQRHCIRLVEGEVVDQANIDLIRSAAVNESKSVLVVCNVVARAQDVYETISEPLASAGIETVLLHGRFNMRDRLKKEEIIRERTGADISGTSPIVVVATQAVEVSLDIDLDTIFSEPAPLEALVQRFGRVNRRGKKGLTDVHVFTSPTDGQGIYDERLIAGTLRVLTRENGNQIDESAVGKWLDEIYSGEVEEEWRKTYAETAAEFDEAVVQSLRPFQSDRMIESRFDELFDGTEVLPDTYLTEYESLQEQGHRLEASELLVPISYSQLARIKRKGRTWSETGEWPIPVDIPYSEDRGLDLSVLVEEENR